MNPNVGDMYICGNWTYLCIKDTKTHYTILWLQKEISFRSLKYVKHSFENMMNDHKDGLFQRVKY